MPSGATAIRSTLRPTQPVPSGLVTLAISQASGGVVRTTEPSSATWKRSGVVPQLPELSAYQTPPVGAATTFGAVATSVSLGSVNLE